MDVNSNFTWMLMSNITGQNFNDWTRLPLCRIYKTELACGKKGNKDKVFALTKDPIVCRVFALTNVVACFSTVDADNGVAQLKDRLGRRETTGSFQKPFLGCVPWMRKL